MLLIWIIKIHFVLLIYMDYEDTFYISYVDYKEVL